MGTSLEVNRPALSRGHALVLLLAGALPLSLADEGLAQTTQGFLTALIGLLALALALVLRDRRRGRPARARGIASYRARRAR